MLRSRIARGTPIIPRNLEMETPGGVNAGGPCYRITATEIDKRPSAVVNTTVIVASLLFLAQYTTGQD
jgi:hypothetical protein